MKNSESNRKNNEVELLRFLFASLVVLRHTRVVWSNEPSYPYFVKAAFAVEFFFLLSGYLMMASVEKRNMKYPAISRIGSETVGFLKKKVLV